MHQRPIASASAVKAGVDRGRAYWAFGALAVGGLLLAGPTLVSVATTSWSTEQGGGGPLILAIGLWLLSRQRHVILELAEPGALWLGAPVLAGFLGITALARITGIIEIEGFALYGALIAAAYLLIGGKALRALWFPLVFLAFIFPPPDTLFALITQPLKIALSSWAVGILFAFGFPIAVSGVTIQIDQYQLLVAAACAGVNSLISLTALGLFYAYIRHGQNGLRMLLLVAAIIPVAILANLARVMLLILITYYFGDAAGQGFVHEVAGLSTFAAALLLIFLIDMALTVFWRSERGWVHG